MDVPRVGRETSLDGIVEILFSRGKVAFRKPMS